MPRTAQALREFSAFRGFPHLIEVCQAVGALLAEPQDTADLVRGIARDLAARNAGYAGAQAAPYPFPRRGMPPAVITGALDAGAEVHAVAEGASPAADARRRAVRDAERR
ncbi:MAG TPA: hypothetical protein VKV38_00805 [Trebonia sp.]|nr:hypothetical protein [Trebonia sp.]